jgi:hypothetical protein
MACFEHAYVCGSTVKFYKWLETGMGQAIHQGRDGVGPNRRAVIN